MIVSHNVGGSGKYILLNYASAEVWHTKLLQSYMETKRQLHDQKA